MSKISIVLSWPVRWRCITNGEKVIEQIGPDEFAVELREDSIGGESPLVMLNKLLDEYEKERRRVKAQMRRAKITAVPSFSNGGSKPVNDTGSGEGREANKSPKIASREP